MKINSTDIYVEITFFTRITPHCTQHFDLSSHYPLLKVIMKYISIIIAICLTPEETCGERVNIQAQLNKRFYSQK